MRVAVAQPRWRQRRQEPAAQRAGDGADGGGQGTGHQRRHAKAQEGTVGSSQQERAAMGAEEAAIKPLDVPMAAIEPKDTCSTLRTLPILVVCYSMLYNISHTVQYSTMGRGGGGDLMIDVNPNMHS